mgnify:CR=1 FL=1
MLPKLFWLFLVYFFANYYFTFTNNDILMLSIMKNFIIYLKLNLNLTGQISKSLQRTFQLDDSAEQFLINSNNTNCKGRIGTQPTSAVFRSVISRGERLAAEQTFPFPILWKFQTWFLCVLFSFVDFCYLGMILSYMMMYFNVHKKPFDNICRIIPD